MIKCSDGGTYDWIRATVKDDGIDLEYQVTGLTVRGSDFIDDDGVRDWTDDDIRHTAANYLDVVEGEEEIELDWA